MATTYPMAASLKGFEYVSLPYENCVYIPSHVIIAVRVGLLADVDNRCYFVNILEISLRHCHCCSDFES
ncbi:hypothetical protein T03_14590 [Trichinella britovi]|uniref:Uncharacterized protein n=1 Tax=Trichinella britovi TaxID=45882 RepID=A0A0V1CXH1_TRIBR|nr:hypothetical protein T03_14590 [Trichinella britovi]